MLIKLSIAFLLTPAAALASTPEPVAIYTFTCTGNAELRIGPCPQGGRPGYLIQGANGTFYGTTQISSEGTSQPNGGAVFSLTPGGTHTILHTFTAGSGKNYPDGKSPNLLTEGPDGNLYGTTLFGGQNNAGVLYRVRETGSGFQMIHQFCTQTNCADGDVPSLMVVGPDGNLYGTTLLGGTGNCPSGCGAIFRITPSAGTYEVVFSFNETTSGQYPTGFVVASDGTLYGRSFGYLYHYFPLTGAVQATPLTFPDRGGLPSLAASGFTIGSNGNLFGLYQIYGLPGLGLFEVDPDGSNLTLFPRYNTINGGGMPDAMLRATDGNFWISNYNGSSGYGAIVSLSPQGTVLETFTPFGTSSSVGAYPAGLLQAMDGTFWGSTFQYGDAPKGSFGDGVVFTLNAGLPPRD
jgi:uncharacterized repeat protein (TIGR03803 family)